MCCNAERRVFAAVWAILQTCMHLTWSILGTQLYECKLSVKNGTFEYLWYLTYFYDSLCTNSTLRIIYLPNRYVSNESNFITNGTTHTSWQENESYNILSRNKIELNFPQISNISSKTYYIFQIYTIFDALWLVLSIGLLVGASFRIRQKWSAAIYFVWLSMTLFHLICDGIVTCLFCLDIHETYGFTKWFTFVSGREQNGNEEIDNIYNPIVFTFPSIFMALVFSRFILIWIVNLVLFIRISQVAIHTVKTANSPPPTQQCSKPTVIRKAKIDSTNERIRKWQLYYATSSDEEDKQAKTPPRTRRRSSRPKRNDTWRKDRSFQYTGQKLAVIGGYEGDRSASPSPRPVVGCSSGYESDSNTFFGSTDLKTTSLTPSYGSSVDDLKSQLPWSYLTTATEAVPPNSKRIPELP